MSRVIHMCVDLRGVLNWPDYALAAMFRDGNGNKAKGKVIREYLLDQLSLGRKVIPAGPICDVFDYQKGCPGHEVTGA